MKIRVFGVLRNFSDSEGYVEIPFQNIGFLEVSEIRRQLKFFFESNHPSFDLSQIDECAVADEEQIFHDGEKIPFGAQIAILPPVCGG